MSVSNLPAHDKRIYEIAEEYKQQGYRVTIAPHAKQLPPFLNKFRPDIIAEGPNESVVIELKSFGKARQTGYWSQLADVIQQHPGWRFELIIDNGGKRELPQTIKREQIEELLQEGLRLVEAKMLKAALLITWSATEAAMRLASKNYDIELPDFRPATVISRLYTDGLLERGEYNFLLDCMRIRNAAAHGFHEGQIKPEFIKRLHRIALRLLEAKA
jgi:REase_AHJR-like